MIPSDFLSDEEIKAIGKLLRTVLIEDPVFRSGRYHTLTGVRLEDAVERVRAWPDLDMSQFDDRATLRGTISSLVNYPHRCWDRIEQDTGISKEDTKRLLKLIRAAL